MYVLNSPKLGFQLTENGTFGFFVCYLVCFVSFFAEVTFVGTKVKKPKMIAVISYFYHSTYQITLSS